MNYFSSFGIAFGLKWARTLEKHCPDCPPWQPARERNFMHIGFPFSFGSLSRTEIGTPLDLLVWFCGARARGGADRCW